MIITPPIRPRRRKPSLTPMIDVVFLLLVFFMLAARFGGLDAIETQIGSSGAGYSGAPRLITVGPDSLALNGQPVSRATLIEALAPLMTSKEDIVVLRPTENATTQDLISLITWLNQSGMPNITVVE